MERRYYRTGGLWIAFTVGNWEWEKHLTEYDQPEGDQRELDRINYEGLKEIKDGI